MRRIGPRRVPTLLTALLVCLAAAAPALAVDGVLEINQACVAAGCFPGDAAGFPVSITQPGSYRLTGNLTVPDENTTAILVQSPDVDLDLNGFTISGVTSCTGFPLACSPTGSGNGVLATIDQTNVAVHGGVIRGMGSLAVDLIGLGARVEGVNASFNGQGGVVVNIDGFVNRVTSLQNGGGGIFAGVGSTVAASRADTNTGVGIHAGASSSVIDNVAYDNDLQGIVADGPGTVAGNTATANESDGIKVLASCLVRGNTSTNNGGWGLNLAGNSGYSDNVIDTNGSGTVTGGTPFGHNLCNGSTTCP